LTRFSARDHSKTPDPVFSSQRILPVFCFGLKVPRLGENAILVSVLDLVKIVIPGEIIDYLDFWPLLTTCHWDDMCDI
jgi:hypothetical protein